MDQLFIKLAPCIRAWLPGIVWLIMETGFPVVSVSQNSFTTIAGSADTLPASVKVKLGSLSGSQTKMNFLLQYVEENENKIPENACIGAREAVKLAKKNGSAIDKAKSLYWLSLMEYRTAKNDENLELPLLRVVDARKIFEEKKDLFWLMLSYDLEATIRMDLEDFEFAWQSLNQAFSIDSLVRNKALLAQAGKTGTLAEKRDSIWDQALAGIYVRKAVLLSRTGNDIQAVKDCLSEANHLYESVGDKAGMALVLLSQAALAEFDQKPEIYQRAIQFYSGLGFYEKLRDTYLMFGQECINYYNSVKDEKWFGEGIRNLHLAKQLHSGCDVLDLLGYAHHARAAIMEAGSPDMRLHTDSANYYYQLAIDSAKATGNNDCLNRVVLDMISICENNENCPELTVKLPETYEAILEKQKAAKEEAQNYQQEAEAARVQKQRLQLIGGSGAVLLVALLSFIGLYQRQRIRNINKTLAYERDVSAAKQAAARAQMDPHFISNVMNAIDNLVNFGRREDASEALIEFSRLARMVLEHSRQEEISLAGEIACLEKYLNLEKLRFGEQFNYKLDIDRSLDKEKVLIPSMLIQPFAENAIKHGIQPKQSPGLLTIRIHKKDPDMLECIVDDDGIGRKRAKELRASSIYQESSLGTILTKERIHSINKIKEARLDIVDLHTQAGIPSGTRVIIKLPLKIAAS